MNNIRKFGKYCARIKRKEIKHMLTKSPVRKNLLANFFGVGVNLLNQIVLVPFYIVCWGNDLYSDWIVLSSLTAIFSMTDVGLNNVIQNQFSIKYAEGETKICNSLLSCNVVIVTITFLAVILLAFAYLLCVNVVENMNLHVLNKTEASIVFIMLLVKVFITMYSGIQNAIYRATHHADRAIYFDQITFLIVVVVTFGFVLASLSVVYLSIAICIPYIFLIFIKHSDSRRYFNHQISLFHFDLSMVKRMILPSMSFMSFPIGNAIILQGFTLVVNRFFGANEVVLFNTSRTMCNFIKSLLGTIQGSVWPEYSIAYGKSDYQRMRMLHRKSLHLSLVFSFIVGIGLLIFGPLVYRVWTHGEIPFVYPLMFGFIAALIIEGIWISSSVTVMATNNHTRLGVTFVTVSFMSLLISIFMMKLQPSLPLITIPLILLQVVMAYTALKESIHLINESVVNLFKFNGYK